MTIFFILFGMGVVFLLYVLVNFWVDGHRQKSFAWEPELEISRKNKAEVIVVTHPISLSAQGGISIIPFPARRDRPQSRPAGAAGVHRTIEMPGKRFSIR